MRKLTFFIAILFIAFAGNITAQTNYGIAIAGVEVTSANCNNITGAKISGSVSYNHDTKTLTLNNATIEGTIVTGGLESDMAFTINLQGENYMKRPGGGGVIGFQHKTLDLIITSSNDGTLNLYDTTYLYVSSAKSFIIKDCNINIEKGGGDDDNLGIIGEGGIPLIIDNANIVSEKMKIAIGYFADIELIGCEIVEPTNAQIIDTEYNGDYAGKYVCDADGNIAKKVVIKKVANYGIEIAGVKVTSANCNNITGEDIEGKVSYNPTTNTLTLDNATIKGAIVTENLVSDMAFTINLQGENYMKEPGGGVIGFFHKTLDLIITSSNDGTLNVYDTTYLYVAYAKSFIIKDCNINIENSDIDFYDYGIVGNSDATPLIIDNANIEVTTKAAPAIAEWKSIRLTNVDVVEPQNYKIDDFDDMPSCILNEDGTAATHVVIKKKDSGIEKIANNTNEINIYPNPATNEIVISNIANNEIVEIFDITGKLVKKVVYNNKINVSDLLAGVYTIKVNNQIQKLVIE